MGLCNGASWIFIAEAVLLLGIITHISLVHVIHKIAGGCNRVQFHLPNFGFTGKIVVSRVDWYLHVCTILEKFLHD